MRSAIWEGHSGREGGQREGSVLSWQGGSARGDRDITWQVRERDRPKVSQHIRMVQVSHGTSSGQCRIAPGSPQRVKGTEITFGPRGLQVTEHTGWRK